jgi:hypothetical protein
VALLHLFLFFFLLFIKYSISQEPIDFFSLPIYSFVSSLFFSSFFDIIIWKKRSDVQDAWATWKFNPIPSLFLGRVSLSLYLFLVGRVCRIKCYYYYYQLGYYIASYPSVPESC